jgi:hypothetical protein
MRKKEKAKFLLHIEISSERVIGYTFRVGYVHCADCTVLLDYVNTIRKFRSYFKQVL